MRKKLLAGTLIVILSITAFALPLVQSVEENPIEICYILDAVRVSS